MKTDIGSYVHYFPGGCVIICSACHKLMHESTCRDASCEKIDDFDSGNGVANDVEYECSLQACPNIIARTKP